MPDLHSEYEFKIGLSNKQIRLVAVRNSDDGN